MARIDLGLVKGKDGENGLPSAVNGILADASGNIVLTAEDLGAACSFGQVDNMDLLEWASKRIVSGAFIVSPTVTTQNVPVAGWLTGWLDVIGTSKRIAVTVSSGAYPTTYVNVTAGGVWQGWMQLASTDYAVNKNGDTVTGDLFLGDKKTIVRPHDVGSAMWAMKNDNDFDNADYLSLYPNLDMADAYKVGRIDGGVYTEHSLVHAGNLLKKIGVLPVECGGTGVSVSSLAELAATMGAAMIEMGSYTGTGAVSHTINFSFTPKLVILYCIPFVWSGNNTYNYELSKYLQFYFQNATSISVYDGSSAKTTTYSISNNQLARTFSYENSSYSEYICNTKSKKYGYIAIG